MKKRERVSAHLKKYWPVYLGSAIGIAGITWGIMKENRVPNLFDSSDSVGSLSNPEIGSSVTGTAGSSVTGTGETSGFFFQPQVVDNHGVINLQQVIEARRSGPPSWVVRCVDTGDVYTSQRAAATALGIDERNISKMLNGLQETAEGLKFERICLAG